MDFSKITHIYFLGIGGIGMSALASYFADKKAVVSGYDKTPSVITDRLIQQGISINFDEKTEAIPEAFTQKEHTLVVLTPAIPSHHPQYQYFKSNDFQILKRSEVLGYIFNSRNGIAVAGSHGKTSVSSLISWILNGTEEGCTSFIGGISKNINSNLVNKPDSDWVLAEADEFDRSFLRLFPDIAVITSIDTDHLDIYGTREAILESFREFTAQIKEDGVLVMHARLENDLPVDEEIECYTYATHQPADVQLIHKQIVDGKYLLDIELPNGELMELVEFQMPGDLNIENALAAITVAYLLDIPEDILRERLASFNGVLRRFDYQIKTPGFIYIDDYAHHPREISSTLQAIREIYPGKHLTGVFQPHLYTRTRDLADEFAESLDLLDDIVLLDIYPAREEAIPGVSSELIYNLLKSKSKYLVSKDGLVGKLAELPAEVLVTMGAGDIDRLVPLIKNAYLNR